MSEYFFKTEQDYHNFSGKCYGGDFEDFYNSPKKFPCYIISFCGNVAVYVYKNDIEFMNKLFGEV